jgi:hypothetical protein
VTGGVVLREWEMRGGVDLETGEPNPTAKWKSGRNGAGAGGVWALENPKWDKDYHSAPICSKVLILASEV